MRAFDGARARLARRFGALVDETNRSELSLFACNYWLQFRLNALGSVVSGGIGAVLVGAPGGSQLSAGGAGLMLNYAVAFTAALNTLLSSYSEFTLSMACTERCLEYADELPQEAAASAPPAAPVPATWPQRGELVLRALTVRHANAPQPALRSLSLRVAPRSSCGVVGRTGAGKSTLLQAILRIIEPEAGTALLDGVDLREVALDDLRSRVAIVPQDPTLFKGSVRYNLDLHGTADDGALNAALQKVLAPPADAADGGAATQAALSLDFEVAEFGGNLSVGERQLLCLARVFARECVLVLFDEATANIDVETDARIQATLRARMALSTVMTVAHRLATIIHYDTALVLQHGELLEHAPPSELLRADGSTFRAMCAATGDLAGLVTLAETADRERAARAVG